MPLVSCRGRLIKPPSRASAWRYGYNTPFEYDDTGFNCGGVYYQWQIANGSCGICGDRWFNLPRKHEAPGIFATGIITGKYTEGQTINVTVNSTKNRGGTFTFKLCANNNVKKDPKQECLDKYDISHINYNLLLQILCYLIKN